MSERSERTWNVAAASLAVVPAKALPKELTRPISSPRSSPRQQGEGVFRLSRCAPLALAQGGGAECRPAPPACNSTRTCSDGRGRRRVFELCRRLGTARGNSDGILAHGC